MNLRKKRLKGKCDASYCKDAPSVTGVVWNPDTQQGAFLCDYHAAQFERQLTARIKAAAN